MMVEYFRWNYKKSQEMLKVLLIRRSIKRGKMLMKGYIITGIIMVCAIVVPSNAASKRARQ